MPASKIETVKVLRLAQGGEGVGRLADGCTVFIERGLPGDVVELRITKRKKRWARGVITTIVTPSKDRVPSECKHFSQGCGGCHFWTLKYEDEFRLKCEAVFDTLQRISKLSLPEATRHPAPRSSRYRQRATLQISGGKVGFFKAMSHELVAVESCPALSPELDQALKFLADTGEDSVFIEADGDGNTVVDLPAAKLPEGLKSASDQSIKIRSFPRDSVLEYRVPAGGFRQASEEGNKLLTSVLHQFLENSRQGRMLELYSGYGNFTFALASDMKEIDAWEGSPKAVATGNKLAASLNIQNVRFSQGNLETPQFTDEAWDVVLLDPPRGGAREVCELIAEREDIQEIVYVSCDPGALGRDLGILHLAGWDVTSLALIDLFPRTYHLETVALLQRRAQP